MRYALHLLPDAFLLIALLRMTFVHLHQERKALFFFLASWLIYSLVTLFYSQVHPIDSPRYAQVFMLLTSVAWACGLPALMLAGKQLSRNPGHCISVLAVMSIAAAAGHFIQANPSFALLAKATALNCWIAVLMGSVFLFASLGAEEPDRLLWRCCGIFFLLYGFGYMAVGMMDPNRWSYPGLLLLCAMVWAILAWQIGPHPDVLFNLEKLGLTHAAFFNVVPVLRRLRG